MTQRYEREIEEILKNLGERPPEEPLNRRMSSRVDGWRSHFEVPLRNWRRYFTVQWVMVASIAMVMVGFVMRAFLPVVAYYANWLGLLLFVLAIVMSVMRWGGARREKTWRGRVIDISNYDSSWWQSLQRRLRLWWRKRRW